MDRRKFLKVAGGNIATIALLSPAMTTVLETAGMKGAAAGTRKPNIIVILADDLGYGETGCQGGRDIPTPNIDSLAAGGVRFTNAYVSCPVCSPTRAGLMTGRYQQRFGHELNPGPNMSRSSDFGLPLSEQTIADRLKALGYATGIVGKWHLGDDEAHHPMKRGFDEFFGFIGGAHPYFTATKMAPIYRGTEAVQEGEYLTDAFAREASSFIDRHKSQPFFLYFAPNSVHAPLEATDDRLNKFANITDKRRRTFAAMLDALDGAVGKTLQKLRALKLEENTLVVFLSDNGGPTLTTTSKNGPLNGYKAQVLEGGIRVPFIMQWKKHLPAGAVYDNPVISLDILPTALEAAGQKVKDSKVEGVSLLPYITRKQNDAPHGSLFWRFGEQSAVRKGDWKLVRMDSGDTRLFNLKDDIGEKNNLAATNPERLKELIAAYDDWNAKNVEPLWRTGRRKIKRRRRKKQQ